MKNTIIKKAGTILLIGVTAFSVFSGCGSGNTMNASGSAGAQIAPLVATEMVSDSTEGTQTFAVSTKSFAASDISIDDAVNIALGEVGSGATVSKKDYDRDDNKYEIDLYKDGVKYEYKISAIDGSILSVETDKKLATQPAATVPAQTAPATDSTISIDDAVNIALGEVGSGATVSKKDYDRDDNKYEIDLYKDGVKYEYKISTIDGSILSVETDKKLATQPAATVPAQTAPATDSTISIDDAVNIALGEVGSGATVSKKDYDRDDNKYEIDLYKDGVKYEYKISAIDGSILSVETDKKLATQPAATVPAQTAPATDSTISIDDAVNIALGEVGSGATVSKKDYDRDDNKYEIDLYKDGVKYEYKISAIDGSILSVETDKKLATQPAATVPAQTAPATDSTISIDDAVNIALGEVGSGATVSKKDYDRDDNKYEIDLYKDGVKYEYKISAIDGSILSVETDKKLAVQTPATTTSTSAYISMEEAKELVLAEAGANATVLEMDYDDDDAEYEITLYKDRAEYEYKVSAVNGKVYLADVDYD